MVGKIRDKVYRAVSFHCSLQVFFHLQISLGKDQLGLKVREKDEKKKGKKKERNQTSYPKDCTTERTFPVLIRKSMGLKVWSPEQGISIIRELAINANSWPYH